MNKQPLYIVVNWLLVIFVVIRSVVIVLHSFGNTAKSTAIIANIFGIEMEVLSYYFYVFYTSVHVHCLYGLQAKNTSHMAILSMAQTVAKPA